MTEIRTVCVYCGSSPGAHPAYADAARQLGTLLAREGIGLVTGGGKVGLMGIVANAALEAGGEAVGIIPQALLEREVGHTDLTELVVVQTMHERKAIMATRADAVIALPGGLGTLEEITEMLTWAQLGIHSKPCGLLNVGGYYDALVSFLDHAVTERFIRKLHRQLLTIASSPEEMLAGLRAHTPSSVSKWMERSDV